MGGGIFNDKNKWANTGMAMCRFPVSKMMASLPLAGGKALPQEMAH